MARDTRIKYYNKWERSSRDVGSTDHAKITRSELNIDNRCALGGVSRNQVRTILVVNHLGH